MLRKFVPAVKNHDFFLNSGSIFWFLYTAGITCLISCTIGATALLLSGIIRQQHCLAIVCAWWTGDVLGVLLIAPLILTSWRKPVKSLFVSGRKHGNRFESALIFFFV